MRTRIAAGTLICVLTIILLISALNVPNVEDTRRPSPNVTVPVDTADPGRAPDATITAPRAAVTAAARDLHDDLADETPANAPVTDLKAARDAARRIAATKPPLATAGATSGIPGCRTSFVRNQSSRRGVRPVEQTLHYTVSPNRAGWADVNAIVALFDRAAFAASSHFVIDAEGNCAYIVPLEAKAWTQAAGNPLSVSYEIIATGREARYLEPAGLRKLRSVIREVAKRTGIPVRRGRVSSCQPARAGIVEHRDWGLCGGGHVDVTPFRVDDIVRELTAGDVTGRDRATCRRINAWRQAGRPAGGQWEANSVYRRRALARRGVTCTPRGPVRR